MPCFNRAPLLFEITGRKPDVKLGLASMRDFSVSLMGQVVPNYELDRTVIYCYDLQGERVWYTIVSDVEAVLAAPFIYQAQRAYATHIITIPLEALERRDYFPDPRPIFVFSVGRCGSTLLSNLLKASGRRCVSEPDLLSQLAVLRPSERLATSGAGIATLIRGCVASFVRHCGRGVLLKLRHHCNILWPHIAIAVPDARLVFMLRDRLSWARSRHRAFGDGPESLISVLRDGIVSLDLMERAGLNPEVIWYEDLVSDPLSTLRRLGIEADGLGPLDSEILRANLQQDAQIGTGLAKSEIRPRASEEDCLSLFDALWRQVDLSHALRRLKLERLS